MKRLLNKKELAEYLGISFPTLQKRIKEGAIPPPNVGKYWGIVFIRNHIKKSEKEREVNGNAK